MRILTRYILRSLIAPFVFSLSALTLLMLLNELSKRFNRLLGKGLHWTVIVEVFGLSLPFIVAMTAPMAVLLAVLYTFNRMAGDNEITAMKACGIPLPRLLAPVLVVASVLALGLVWFNNTVLPESNHHLQILYTSISQKKPTLVLRERTVNEVLEGELFLETARIDRSTGAMGDLVIYDRREPTRSRTIYADSGTMAFSEDRTDLYLTLYSGVTHDQRLEEPEIFERVNYGKMVMRVPDVSNELQRRDLGGYRGDREMSIGQMRVEVEEGRTGVRRATVESRTVAVALTRRLLDLPLEEEVRSRPGDGPGVGPGERPGEERRRDSRQRQVEGEEGKGGGGPEPSPSQVALEASAGAGAAADGDAPSGSDAPSGGDAPSGNGARADDARYASVDSTARAAALETVRRMRNSRAPAAQFLSLRNRLTSFQGRVNRFEVEIQKKVSIPAACVVFVLIGAPLAIRFREAGVAMVVAASLLIFCAYYVSLVGGEELADHLILTPFWAMWAPNVLFGLLGLTLLWRAVKAG